MKGIIETILSRLDSLENTKPTITNNTPMNDITLIKQIETIKQAVIQIKSTTNTLTKENSTLKSNYESLRTELTETREALNALQTITMEYSQKLLEDLQDEDCLQINDELEANDKQQLDLFQLNDGTVDFKKEIELELNSSL